MFTTTTPSLSTRSFVQPAVPTGDVMISVSQQRVSRGPARVMLKINDEIVGEGMVPNVPAMISSIGMDIGSNPTGVSEAFTAPFLLMARSNESILRRLAHCAQTMSLPSSWSKRYAPSECRRYLTFGRPRVTNQTNGGHECETSTHRLHRAPALSMMR